MGRGRKIGANELTLCIFYFIFTWLMFCNKGNVFQISRLKKSREKKTSRKINTEILTIPPSEMHKFAVLWWGGEAGEESRLSHVSGLEKWWQWQGVFEELFTLGGFSLLQQAEK